MRSIYALVRGILRVYEGGPTVALSLAIGWLFFATSCGLLVAGETEDPLDSCQSRAFSPHIR